MPASPLPLDPNRIRANFPAFSQPELDGLAFFENAGGSYTAAPVLNRLDTYYRTSKLQPYGAYPASQAAGEAMDLAYVRLAAALNVGADWIHIGPSTSANTYALGRAFDGWLEPGEAIVVTNQDHEANSGAWRKLASRGIEVREWRIDPDTGHLDLARLDALLDDKVRLIAMPHASNIVGEVNPVDEVARRARTLGAMTIVDGVSYAPHGLPDVAALGCDIYLFSAYKTYGPHQGVMAIRPSLAASLPNQGHFFNDAKPRYRLVPAGPDHAQIAACAGIVDYLETVASLAGETPGASPFRRAHDAMRAQETALIAPLLDYLRGKNGIRLIGPGDPVRKVPTVSIATDRPAAQVAAAIARHNVGVGGGHFYGYRVLEALGVDPAHGVVRLSFVHYTTPAEIDRLIAALDAEL
ncbi:MAG: aminotransferase class V-fold PLP-dependent enzyme [Devosia sp.]